ncbi:MAG: NADH-quinone oxidoreductase subunit C [Candidatus Dadabacteria bacterium]|nr:MAG: NADH-quinone oxidoreductase subunit C [Candidatus Dadabacteria bacterium]
MDVSAIQKKLAARFGPAVGPVMPGRLESWIEVDADRIDEVAAFLATDPELEFDCLSNLSGVDYPDKGSIEVVYRLFSYRHRHELTIKVDADRNDPRVKTVERVWPAANWLEREVFDLLGVHFEGHSDLRRILLPEDWIGHPLRKDYVEAPEYHGISTIRESILNVPGRS